jgi:photosystem II stability/assembly factor-like uncharacterized protein
MRLAAKTGLLVATAVLGASGVAQAAPNVSVSQSGWFWGTPQPQGNTLRSLDLIGARGYAAGDFGTVLRTDDGGSSWSGLQTGVTVNLGRVRMIGADSFVVSGGCTVRRSDDGGRSFRRLPWTASDERCSSGVVGFSFPSSQVGYLQLADGNVLRSSDSGTTWSRRTVVPGTRAAPGGGNAAPTDIVFTGEDTGFVSTSYGAVYQTSDGGSTWTPSIEGWEAPLRGLAFPDPQHGYVVGDNGVVIQTSDGGATWGLTQYTAVDNFTAIDCINDQRCLVGTAAGDRLARTEDGGANWTYLTPSSDRIRSVAFADENRATAVGDGGATVISNDGGSRFSRVGGRLVGTYTGLRATTTNFAYAFGRGGALAKSLDGGATWHAIDVATPDNVIDADFPTTSVGFALDSVGQLLRTNNGGISWQILNTGTDTQPDGVLALDPRRLLLIGPTGIRVSSNGGGDFAPVRVKKIQQAPLHKSDAVGGTAFVYGPQAIFFSRNGGSSWRSWRVPFQLHKRKAGVDKKTGKQKYVFFYTRRIEDIDFVSTRTAYLLDDLGRVWRTTNSGRSWRPVAAVGTEQGYDLEFSDASRGWMALSEFGDSEHGWVLRTTDGGRSWRPQLIGAAGIVGGGLAAPGPAGGFALASPNLLFGTTTGGDRGADSAVSLSVRSKRPRKPGTVRLDGRLTSAKGGEDVVVSMRPVGDAAWQFETVQVASNGRFTVVADLTKTTDFVAQWAGDDTRVGDGSRVLRVRVVKPKKKKGAAKATPSRFIR